MKKNQDSSALLNKLLERKEEVEGGRKFKKRFPKYPLIAFLLQEGYSNSVIFETLLKNFPTLYSASDKKKFHLYCTNNKSKILAEKISQEDKDNFLVGVELPASKRKMTERQRNFEQFKQWDNDIENVLKECQKAGKNFGDKFIAQFVIDEYMKDKDDDFKKQALPRIVKRVKTIRASINSKLKSGKLKSSENFDFNNCPFLDILNILIEEGKKPKAIINELAISYPNNELPTPKQISQFKARLKQKKSNEISNKQPKQSVSENQTEKLVVKKEISQQDENKVSTNQQVETKDDSSLNKWAARLGGDAISNQLS